MPEDLTVSIWPNSIEVQFEKANITILEWPANSPDFIPIENRWDLLLSRTIQKMINPCQAMKELTYRRVEQYCEKLRGTIVVIALMLCLFSLKIYLEVF